MRPKSRRLAFLTLPAAVLALALWSATAAALTPPPVLLSPTSGAASRSPLMIRYELPEAAAPGSVILAFKRGEADTVVTLASGEGSAGEHTVSLQTSDLTADKGEVKAAAPGNELVDGTYEITLSYQDEKADPPASTTVKGVTLDTVTDAPTLVEPTSEASLEGAFSVAYELPEAASPGSVALVLENEEFGTSTLVLANSEQGKHTVKVEPSDPLLEAAVASAPAKLAPGAYRLRLQYQDALGNPVAGTAPIKLVLLALKCSLGSYSESGRAPCTEAAPGHYVEAAGSTTAIPCMPGTYDPASGSTTSAACLEAEAGHYVATTGAASQSECPPGAYQPETGSFQCTLAGLGHYVATGGSSVEYECPAGTYADTTDSSVCKLTPEGHYSGAGASLPIDCPPGTSNPDKNGASLAACVADQPGYYSPAAASDAIACLPGSYAPERESFQCTAADPGFYVSGEHASSELPCPAGHYSPFSGDSQCAPAPVGTYASAGAKAPTACPAGSEAPVEGLGACIPIIATASSTSPTTTSTTSLPAAAAPECMLAAVAKQLSLARTGRQAFTLTCNQGGKLAVGAIVTITAGHHRLRLAAVASSVSVAPGVHGRETLRVKLTGAARKLLRGRGTRVTVAVTVTAPAVSGSAPKPLSATLTGRR
jgi:hypothetical protein